VFLRLLGCGTEPWSRCALNSGDKDGKPLEGALPRSSVMQAGQGPGAGVSVDASRMRRASNAG
jgi:hypothetical protein